MFSISTIFFLIFIVTVSSEFICPKKGRYIDETDLECRRYFLCSQKKNGDFVRSTYDCPTNTFFDTSLGFCTSSAICAFKTTEPPTSTEPSTTSETPSSLKPTTATESPTSEEPPITATTSTTTEPTKAPLPEDTIIPPYHNYTCLSEGRFPDSQACDCGWFYDCHLSDDDHLSATRLYCPKNMKFDPKSASCSSFYDCPQEFVCNLEGLFPDEFNSTNYYKCEVTEDGSFLQTHYACPRGMSYNEDQQICGKDLIETTTESVTEIQNVTSSSPTTSSATTETSNLTTPNDVPSKFNCSNLEGRFSDPEDEVCKGYYLCIDHQAFRYNCPKDLLFDPKLQECTDFYRCPLEGVTEKWTTIFNCKKRGYFKNFDDSSSKAYHFCEVLGDGKIYQYELMCPAEYIFDDNTNLCKN